jgi:Na+/proline symporter
MPVSVVAAVLSLHAVGGVNAFFQKLPSSFYHWGENANSNLVAMWVFITLIQKFVSTNSMQDSSRYLSVKDSRHARKAALLGAILHTVGPLLWFIPPMAARILYPHIEQMFPGVKNPQEASFFAIAVNTMPAGMVGLLLSAIFGATMSAMDGGLNKNAGFFVKNFYQPYLNPRASEKQLLVIGKITTLLLGAIIISAGLLFAAWKGTNIFKQMTLYSGLVGLPVTIPLVLGLMIKKAPGWAGWSTVLVTLGASLVSHLFLTSEFAGHLLGFTLNSRDAYNWDFLSGTSINILVGCTWFCGSCLFAARRSDEEKRHIKEFFEIARTPVDFEKEEGDGSDNQQASVMGILCLVYGAFLLLLMAIPNPLARRFAFAFCALVMSGIGVTLRRAGQRRTTTEAFEIEETAKSR